MAEDRLSIVQGGNTDIQSQVESSLKTVDDIISKTESIVNEESLYVEQWENRIIRATEVLSRVKPEGQVATETLIRDAREHLKQHEAKLLNAGGKLEELRKHRDELFETSKGLQDTERKLELHNRLRSIHGTIAPMPTGDDEKLNLDLREIGRTVHAAQALIELREGK